jgi:hypothetical protein
LGRIAFAFAALYYTQCTTGDPFGCSDDFSVAGSGLGAEIVYICSDGTIHGLYMCISDIFHMHIVSYTGSVCSVIVHPVYCKLSVVT